MTALTGEKKNGNSGPKKIISQSRRKEGEGKALGAIFGVVWGKWVISREKIGNSSKAKKLHPLKQLLVEKPKAREKEGLIGVGRANK